MVISVFRERKVSVPYLPIVAVANAFVTGILKSAVCGRGGRYERNFRTFLLNIELGNVTMDSLIHTIFHHNKKGK